MAVALDEMVLEGELGLEQGRRLLLIVAFWVSGGELWMRIRDELIVAQLGLMKEV